MEKIFFENINNKKIFCYLSKPKISQKKIIIMSHGFRGSSVGPARQFVDFQRILNIHGFSVLRFDQPNSGNSDGDYVSTSFNEWVSTIVHFVKKYINRGYKVALLGQSMGAAAAVIATSEKEIEGKIPCILLWVPGVISDNYKERDDKILEENGQKYKGKFWNEAISANFYKCLELYMGGVHVVYGEQDRYVSEKLRSKTIQKVISKKQEVMILKGQDHSPWEYDVAQTVYKEEIKFLQKYLI